jgi:hypothetical protein
LETYSIPFLGLSSSLLKFHTIEVKGAAARGLTLARRPNESKILGDISCAQIEFGRGRKQQRPGDE